GCRARQRQQRGKGLLMPQVLFPPDIIAKLRVNNIETRTAQRAGHREPDHVPVVKIFNPVGAATWILTELEDDGETLYGLCDLGMGSPELGYVGKTEMETAQFNRLGLPLERDEHFRPQVTLSVYAEAARFNQRITENAGDLAKAAA